MSNEIECTMNIARREGQLAKSILDNPYWATFPKNEGVVEESKARHWVDGYCERFNNAEAT